MTLDASDIADLRPILRETVAAVLAEVQQADSRFPHGRIALSEAEAAVAIGVQKSTLRDLRLKGELRGRRVGRSWFYEIGQLRDWLISGEQ